jgi:hypothetical protein
MQGSLEEMICDLLLLFSCLDLETVDGEVSGSRMALAV